MNRTWCVPAIPNATVDVEWPTLKKFNFIAGVFKILYILPIVGGNSLVICSILLFGNLRRHSNYLQLSLAVSDLLVGLLTCPTYAIMYLGPESLRYNRNMCYFWFCSVLLGCGASLINYVMIAFDRFLAIMFPIFYYRQKTFANTCNSIALCWTFTAFFVFLPFMEYSQFDATQKCSVYASIPRSLRAILLTLGCCLILSSAMYTFIFVKVIRVQNSTDISTVKWIKEAETIKQSVTMFSIYVMFWIPYVTAGVIILGSKSRSKTSEMTELVKNITLLVAFANSFVNPLVLGFVRNDFRVAYYFLLTTSIKQWTHLNQPQRSNSFKAYHGTGNCQMTC